MKMKSLVIILVCLMATSVFATNSWKATGGEQYWSEASGWTAGIPDDSQQIKLANNSGNFAPCILNTAAVNLVTNKLTIGGTASSGLWADSPLLTIVDGGSIGIGNELQIGDSSSKRGRLVQTGGTLNITGTGKVEVGYKSVAGYGGTYTISGGTVAGSETSKLMVGGGGAANSEGVLTIQGSAASITVGFFSVGCSDSVGTYAGTGRVAFEVVNGNVSAINAGKTYIDPLGAANSITSLLISATGAAPTADILLINNTSNDAVLGVFDNAAEGAIFTLGGVDMTLTYAGGDGNDVMLLIPEPITMVLFGLGLLAVRRK
ncbi:MAG: PEP-CTERM sorting domain-containing protein [Phycisphaerales bacterium]